MILTLLLMAPSDLGEATTIFKAKCSQCHSSSKPKGGIIIADFPAHIKDMIALVSSGNMPQRPAPPLTNVEKETILAWAAAPNPLIQEPQVPSSDPAALVTSTPVSEDTMEPAVPSVSFIQHLAGWLGKFHLLILHFPIALILCAAVSGMWGFMYKSSTTNWRWIAGALLTASAVTAIPTVLLGWIYAYSGAGEGQSALSLHRWMGTTAAILCSIGAIANYYGRQTLAMWLTYICAMVAAVAAHIGGVMVHGPDFLSW